MSGQRGVVVERPTVAWVAPVPRVGGSSGRGSPKAVQLGTDDFDHFLSSDLVRRVIVLAIPQSDLRADPQRDPRRACGHQLAREPDASRARPAYYDRAGALKDMVQNHLMEAMALVLTEQPARIDVRVAPRHAASRLSAQSPRRRQSECGTDTERARYTAGIDRRPPGAVIRRRARRRPRRAARDLRLATVDVDNPRWAGVPFTMRSGKAQATDSAEIAIHFRPHADLPARPVARRRAKRAQARPHRPLRAAGYDTQRPGTDRRDPRARSAIHTPRFEAYAHLVHQMLQNDPMLFIRGDEAEEAWRIIDPVVRAWSTGEVPIQEYTAGTAPPAPPSDGRRSQRPLGRRDIRSPAVRSGAGTRSSCRAHRGMAGSLWSRWRMTGMRTPRATRARGGQGQTSARAEVGVHPCSSPRRGRSPWNWAILKINAGPTWRALDRSVWASACSVPARTRRLPHEGPGSLGRRRRRRRTSIVAITARAIPTTRRRTTTPVHSRPRQSLTGSS